MDNRFQITGTIVDVYETKQLSAYFRKREFKIRYTDVEFNGKAVERRVKFGCLNDDIKLLDDARTDDVVNISFYIDGRDITKNDVTNNYTSLVCFELEIISSPSRSNDETRSQHIIPGGKAPLKESTVEEIINSMSNNQEDDIFSGKSVIKNEKEYNDLPF